MRHAIRVNGKDPPFGLDKPGLLAQHTSFGMTVLKPAGWMMTSAKGASASWFGLWTVLVRMLPFGWSEK